MNASLQVVETNNQRVLTTAQIAEWYGTDTKAISKNFTRNKERYTEGKHYYCLTGDAKREFLNRYQIDDGLRATVFLPLDGKRCTAPCKEPEHRQGMGSI